MWLLVSVVLTLCKRCCFGTWERLRKMQCWLSSTLDFELLQPNVSVQESWSSSQTTALHLGSLRLSTTPCWPKLACTISTEVRPPSPFQDYLLQDVFWFSYFLVYNILTLFWLFRQCWSWHCLRQVLQGVLPQYHRPRLVPVELPLSCFCPNLHCTIHRPYLFRIVICSDYII